MKFKTAGAALLLLVGFGVALVAAHSDVSHLTASFLHIGLKEDVSGDVTWTGMIEAVLEGGAAIALRGVDIPGGQFYAYVTEGVVPVTSGSVRVHGMAEGVTCAYERTIFGSCVPQVRILDITTVPR